MSTDGLFEHRYFSTHRLSGGWIVQDGAENESIAAESATGRETQQLEEESASSAAPATITRPTFSSQQTQTIDESYTGHRATKRARVSFYDFAAQARLLQHHENRKRSLSTRKQVLQRSIALSARLRRTSSWVQDGLVEISKHQDPAGFARVFSHAHDLVDVCYSYWNNELQNIDTIQASQDPATQNLNPAPFFDQLLPDAQKELLDLLSNLRSNPRFLVERLMHLPLSQVAILTGKPKWEASESLLASLSQTSGGSAQRRRRVQAFSKELEDYATSFERSDPLSFLLHNLYGHDTSPDAPESQLRLSTWSTICAELLHSRSESYNSLYWQAFEAFSAMQDWPARTRVELFLMDVLQRGAFLISDHLSPRTRAGQDTLNTEQAHEFLESAVSDLYWTLIKCNTGCYPTGALALARAILGKLPNVQHQAGFRIDFFQKWFLNHFLKAAIMFPENEDMLLKIHVSRRAREYILAPLFTRFVAKFEHFMDPDTEVNENIRNMIFGMINMLDGQEVADPYQNVSTETIRQPDTSTTPVLVLCPSEIVKVIETLSPQAIHSSHYSNPALPVMRDVGHAFQQDYYSRPNTRFDMLKQALLQLIEPGTSAKDRHPCTEAWSDFQVGRQGRVARQKLHEDSDSLQGLTKTLGLSLPQQAALRLCTGSSDPSNDDAAEYLSRWTPESTLTELFTLQLDQCQAETHTVDSMYWRKALNQLHRQYPLAQLANTDTMVLSRPLQHIQSLRESHSERCATIEEQLGPCEKAYRDLKKQISKFTHSLEELRLKLWYTSEIVNSQGYTDAKNVAVALSHMNISKLRMTTNLGTPSNATIRPSSSRSAASSFLGQRQDSTLNLLKASTEHGGPRKLADEQIDAINQWLQQYGIDNFCKGEERFHRFCMEIFSLSRKLTGENVMESGELWSSDLFFRERSYYDVLGYGINSAPASVMSETFPASATYPVPRPTLRSIDSDARSNISDDRSSYKRGSVYNLFQRSLNPQLLAPSLASSMGSYGRASSASTNFSDIFSQPSQSVTSASVISRPASILQGGLPNFGPRPVSSVREKKKFRMQVRKGIVCLLLSDLGSLVWSWGCETDAWVTNVHTSPQVMDRLEKRLSNLDLLAPEPRSMVDVTRRQSTGEVHRVPKSEAEGSLPGHVNATDEGVENDYDAALQDILLRLSQQIDPVGKLQACVDLNTLVLGQLDLHRDLSSEQTKGTKMDGAVRRNSLGQQNSLSTDDPTQKLSQFSVTQNTGFTESQIMHHLKRQFARLRPQTIFRDLQYIAVFTPPEMLDKTVAGKAFMNIGMAAIGYKSELCGSMIDVADQIVAADSVKRRRSINVLEQQLSRAADYWKIAALEGNRVAQRELALLYLMHPELIPVVTLPLSLSADIFKDDMMWQRKMETNNSRQALCLALHWMQLAAQQGDKIAKKRVEEREGGLSIR
ncbi:hypothetical protein PMZ80_006196 [Knufia obscura]|uniref:Uncharacterized protein n=1 Tax=Knufia obscura TaxID=1635080 RepID=A0ABR0RJZ5_9EURO|nr:hypothetical protein PMZ80_006196 [Knufia obscura]